MSLLGFHLLLFGVIGLATALLQWVVVVLQGLWQSVRQRGRQRSNGFGHIGWRTGFRTSTGPVDGHSAPVADGVVRRTGGCHDLWRVPRIADPVETHRGDSPEFAAAGQSLFGVQTGENPCPHSH